MKKKKVQVIKTDKVWFINVDNYSDYFINELWFNRGKAKKTFSDKWFQIEKPKNDKLIIEEKIQGEQYNKRYEIKDKELISPKLPEIVKIEDKEKFRNKDGYDYPILETFYEYKYEVKEPYFKELEFEIEILMELENFKFPTSFEYEGIRRWNYNEEPYKINRKSIEHSELDKMIFPEILLPTRPCYLSSKQMYDITRQYVKENIDNSVARITSDYDFCFTVKKLVKLLEPKKITYQNFFAPTKKQRQKLHFTVKEYSEVEIYQMTHDQENYRGYTAIEPMYANNEEELKEKVDTWLEDLISTINEPLNICPCCGGTGYKEIEKKETNDRENMEEK